MHNFLVQGTSIKGTKLTKKQIEVCHQPFVELNVYWNGEVGLCCWDYDNMIKLGNLNETSIMKIYNNKVFQMVRRKMLDKNCNFMPCKICSQIYGKDLYKEFTERL